VQQFVYNTVSRSHSRADENGGTQKSVKKFQQTRRLVREKGNHQANGKEAFQMAFLSVFLVLLFCVFFSLLSQLCVADNRTV
jgi:hypothetical protein